MVAVTDSATGMDPYRVLGVGRDATPYEIHSAYRRMAREFHPDGGGGGEAEMAAINEAWTVLRDRSKRAAYDATTRVDITTPPQTVHFTNGEYAADVDRARRKVLRVMVVALLVLTIVVFVAIFLIGFGRIGVSTSH
jgi:curved DNA-binding protein CbpA